MSFARDSATGGFVSMFVYMSRILSSLRFCMVYMMVPSGLCKIVRCGFVGRCMSSYCRVGCVSRLKSMGNLENVRLGVFHPPMENAFFGGARFLFLFCWVRCL